MLWKDRASVTRVLKKGLMDVNLGHFSGKNFPTDEHQTV